MSGLDQAPRRRGPGRPRVLSEADVVDAAIVLVRECGLDGLSMRSVARALGVPPMTVYGYVPNKHALEALLIDRILSEVHIPGPEEGTWDVRLRLLLCDARRVLVERPDIADARSAIRRGALHLLELGAYGKEATRLADGVLDLLRDGGFRPDDLNTCFITLFTFVTGHIEPEQITPPASGTADVTAIPRTGTETFAFGLEALIEGLKLMLRPG